MPKYARATVVVLNDDGHILIVKYIKENSWALPGGRIMVGEDPARRAALDIAEETSLQVHSLQRAGFYTGRVAVHDVFVAKASGTPRPNRRELQDAVWWDGRDLDTQTHVAAILAVVRMNAPQEGGLSRNSLPAAREP